MCEGVSVFEFEGDTRIATRVSRHAARSCRLPPGPQGIAVDGSNVYWTAGEDIMRAPLAGGAPVVVASGQTQPTGVAVDDARVY